MKIVTYIIDGCMLLELMLCREASLFEDKDSAFRRFRYRGFQFIM